MIRKRERVSEREDEKWLIRTREKGKKTGESGYKERERRKAHHNDMHPLPKEVPFES